jgi:hypothetical protein
MAINPAAAQPHFDPIYFSPASWADRVTAWQAAAPAQFSAGNEQVVRTAISDPEAGLRVVINIGVWALLQLLAGGRYLNLYELVAIGVKKVSQDRIDVDTEFGYLGEDVYFAAVALGGVGVRFYGEYCMVLDIDRIDPDPLLFDRDSYDILIKPLAGLPGKAAMVACLRGEWADVHDMVLMKVLPELVHQRRLATAGTVSETVLKDQEFIEVHLRPGKDDRPGSPARSFGIDEVDQLLEAPDEVAVSSRLHEREAAGQRLSDIEHEWLLRREQVGRATSKRRLATRVVTQHGKGYQWK